MMRNDNEFFLERVFEEAANIFAPLAKVTGTELVFVPSADLPVVCKADALLVQKLINGLLSQATFFRDGEVRMDAFVVNGSPLIRPSDAQCVHLRIVVASTPLICREQGPHTLLRDQKPMIEINDKIRTSLDDCNDLARMLGGNVQVSDASEAGLSIRADIVLGVPDSQPQVLALSTWPEPGRKVLVIDDNAAARSVMTEHLHRLGLESLSALRSKLRRIWCSGSPATLEWCSWTEILSAKKPVRRCCPAALPLSPAFQSWSWVLVVFQDAVPLCSQNASIRSDCSNQ
jgi:CheY-like chemotaxis protein